MTDSPVRLTLPTATVMLALAGGHRWGFDIIDVTGLHAGTVYPILRRLEAASLVASSWENTRTAHADLRPARRYYRLTAAGQALVRQAAARFPQLAMRPATA